MEATTDFELVAGVPWPEIIQPGDRCVHFADRPWVLMEGYEGTYIKVLYADKEKNMAVILGKMGPNWSFPIHEHTCRALAFTLDGAWSYGDKHMTKNSLMFEDVGSTHLPETGAEGFTVLTVLIGAPGQDTLLRIQDPESLEVYEQGIDYFIDLMENAPEVDGID